MPLDEHDIARLRSQMSRAEVVLFTGAGFSLDAKDLSGRSVPSSKVLREELWSLCFPETEFDPEASLPDLYGAALRRRRTDLRRVLQTRFAVDPQSLPEFYRLYFDLPWLRCYTLNVDDLERAAASRFRLRRLPETISATTAEATGALSGLARGRVLEVVHLNGFLDDEPEKLTFSESQYAERLSGQDAWYVRCVADITCRPVVFIGTPISESLLWQHMELRKKRNPHGRDLRPTSILIGPSLTLPRQEILKDLRIEWFQGTAESFAAEVLANLTAEAASGHTFIDMYSEGRTSETVPLVSELAAERPSAQTEYLLGEEPQWSDVLSGRAIERSNDRDLLNLAEEILEGRKQPGTLAITGTAGTGKSTALMSLALRLTGMGIPVLWLDKDSNVALTRIREKVRDKSGKLALAIDDADVYGRDLIALLRTLVPRSPEFLFALAVRSGRLDEITSALAASGDVAIYEHVVPPLTDDDIDSLIAVLDQYNRLGILKGRSHEERRKLFREQAGRQMLVAMIQATSGENFERKAHDELTQLQGTQRYIYSLISLSSSLRNYLTRDEIVIACDESREDAMPSLERLAARHLVTANPPTYNYRARHRVIADLVVDKLIEIRELKDVFLGLAWACAAKVNPFLDRKSRVRKFLSSVMNHDILLRMIGVMDARDFYAEIENVLNWDYHYWLQRGSLEVEAGDIRLAENFLGAAYSIASGDYRVQTAYAYMLMRKAWESPHGHGALATLTKGIDMLHEVIENWGTESSYPFHVLGSQGLAWARRGPLSREEKRAFLQDVLELLDRGIKLHPGRRNLVQLRADLYREYLMTAVVDRPTDAGRAD